MKKSINLYDKKELLRLLKELSKLLNILLVIYAIFSIINSTISLPLTPWQEFRNKLIGKRIDILHVEYYPKEEHNNLNDEIKVFYTYGWQNVLNFTFLEDSWEDYHNIYYQWFSLEDMEVVFNHRQEELLKIDDKDDNVIYLSQSLKIQTNE